MELGEPAQPEADGRMPAGALCVIAIDAERRARVRFLPDLTGGLAKAGGCLLLIPGGMWGRAAFVPEARAGELERLIREQPGALTVDLAVRADIQALRIDGQVLGR